MDALGSYWASQESVRYPLALCTPYGPSRGMKKLLRCPRVHWSQQKREVRRGFCLLSMPGAAGESQYPGRPPRALCSIVRGGTRRGRMSLCSWSFNYSSLASLVFSLSQGALVEDCIGTVGGRQGNERRKSERKAQSWGSLLTANMGKEMLRAGEGEGSAVGLPEVTSMEQMSMDICVCKTRAQCPVPKTQLLVLLSMSLLFR